MVRNYIKKKPPPSYTAEDLANAVADVRNQNKTYDQAAEYYNVPSSCISDRINNKVKSEEHMGAGRKTALTAQVENEIAECLIARSQLGNPCGKAELLEHVAEYVTNNNMVTPFNNNKPGEDWYFGFMRRHPRLSLKKAEHLQKSRKDARDPDIVYAFYGIVKSQYDEHKLHDKPEFVLNADEASFPHDPSKSRGIGEKSVPLSRVSGGSGRENTSVLGCASAAGYYLPPLLIFKGAAVQARWVSKEAFPGTTYAASSNGWMEEPVFYSWFQNSFIPTIDKLREEKNLPDQQALLLYDGHSSHYSIRIIKLAMENKITLMKLPSHLTDRLQPLDKGVYGPLKAIWDKRLVENVRNKIGFGTARLDKQEFSELLGRVWREGMKKSNIISAFKSTGIHPLNPEKFDRSYFKPSELRYYENQQLRKRTTPSNPAPSTPLSPPKKARTDEAGSSSTNEGGPKGTATQTDIVETHGANDTVETNDVDVSTVALDLRTKLDKGTPEKPLSVIDVFASHLKRVPQRNELTALKPKTPVQVARLKCLKYGEVLTTETVLQRIEEAAAAKEAKKGKKKDKTTTKKVPNQKDKDLANSESEDEPAPIADEESDDDNDDEESDDEEEIAPILLTEDFVDSEAGSKATVESFVLVRFKNEKMKDSFVYYVGKVLEVLTDDLYISFLRKKTNTFVFPNEPDLSTILKIDVKKVLMDPAVRRGYHSFDISFPSDMTLK